MADKLQQLVIETMLELQSALRIELQKQGHELTGKLSDSITFTTVSDGSTAVGQMFFEDYGLHVQLGVKAENIPFGKGRGKKGGTSKYIQGLIEFWEHRGLSGREAIGAAFATAHVHAREGMPSRASYRYSETGERTGFVRSAITDNIDQIGGTIEKRFGAILNLRFADALSDNDSIRLQT